MQNYMSEYFGPTFLIKSPIFKNFKYTETIYNSCDNEDCSCYHSNDNAMMKYCPQCGNKLKKIIIDCNKNMGIYDSEDDNAKLIDAPFIFLEACDLVFIPDLDKKAWKDGTIKTFNAHKSVLRTCQNIECQFHDSHVSYDYNYCTDCGVKVNFSIEERIESDYPEELIALIENDVRTLKINLFQSESDSGIMRKSNVEEFLFLDNHSEFDEHLSVFKSHPTTLKVISVLEDIYGKGSVEIFNYHLQYNHGY